MGTGGEGYGGWRYACEYIIFHCVTLLRGCEDTGSVINVVLLCYGSHDFRNGMAVLSAVIRTLRLMHCTI